MRNISGWLSRALPWLVLTLAVAMAGQYLFLVDREQRSSACQTSYNGAFAQNLIIRSRLGDRSAANTTGLILAVGKLIATPPATDPKDRAARAVKFRTLFVDYATEASDIASERAAHPLPPIPDC